MDISWLCKFCHLLNQSINFEIVKTREKDKWKNRLHTSPIYNVRIDIFSWNHDVTQCSNLPWQFAIWRDKVISNAIKESITRSLREKKTWRIETLSIQPLKPSNLKKKSIPEGWPRKYRALFSPKTNSAQCLRKIWLCSGQFEPPKKVSWKHLC